MSQRLWGNSCSPIDFAVESGNACLRLFIERCVVAADPYFVESVRQVQWTGCTVNVLQKNRQHMRKPLHVLLSVAPNVHGMDAHFGDRWFLVKQRLQNGESWMGDAESGDETECWALCGSWCHIGVLVGGNREDKPFLQNDLIDDKDFE